MTYGVMPSYSKFQDAFDAETGGQYSISNDRHGRSGRYDARELWRLLSAELEKWEAGNEEAGDFVSAVLSTLGFEWI